MVRLNTIPPKGAGQVKGITQTDRLIRHIQKLGTDKYGNPVSIRTNELAEATGIDSANVAASLAIAIRNGLVVVCKVTSATGRATNEYRAGPGVPPPEHKPLNTRKAGVASGAPTKPLPVTRPAVQLSTPVAPANEIDIPVFIKQTAQPAPSSSPTPQEPAASSTAPDPDAGAVRHEPAARKIQQSNTLRLSIDQDGRLQVGDDADPAQIVFPPEHTLALGDFLALTQGVWRP
jgi:hypothetical protein